MAEVETTGEMDATSGIATLEARIAELETRAVEQARRAELTLEAVRAGIVDLDGLKLLPPTVAGAEGDVAVTVRELKRAKPWLFSGSSSSTAVAPPSSAPKPRRATEMNDEDWQAARAELLKRR